jgi:hypothetical protein
MMTPSKRTMRCPGCGSFIVLDDATCTMRHPNPLCRTFEAIMRRFNMTSRVEPWAEMVRSDGSVVKKGDA